MRKSTAVGPEYNEYYIGIDVHKRNWTVTVRYQHMELKTFSMEPSAAALKRHLDSNYPDGRFFSVYEAGFSGFSAHRQLCALGVANIVVHAADVPTSDKERERKSDPRDSRKLARELQKGELQAIYVASEQDEEFRMLCRLRERCQREVTRTKNRIRGHLSYFGLEAPDDHPWSGAFIRRLREEFCDDRLRDVILRAHLDQLDERRRQLSGVLREVRAAVRRSRHAQTLRFLLTIPGIGFITAITLISELVDIGRFPSLNELCAIVGLAPSTSSSGERDAVRGLSRRKNHYLKHLIIESAWLAVRKDPAMLASYQSLTRRMRPTRAIIRSARKLLNRVRFVWRNQQPYVSLVS